MTNEDLTDELKKLTSQLEQAMANVHALNGAIQFARHMLDKWDTPLIERVPPASHDH